MCLEGTQTCLGIPYAQCPGNTFAEKRDALGAFSVDDMENIVKNTGGFLLNMSCNDDCAFVLPSGFVVTWISHGSSCVRWNVSSDESDDARVKHLLTEAVQSFADFRAPDCVVAAYLAFLSE